MMSAAVMPVAVLAAVEASRVVSSICVVETPLSSWAEQAAPTVRARAARARPRPRAGRSLLRPWLCALTCVDMVAAPIA